MFGYSTGCSSLAGYIAAGSNLVDRADAVVDSNCSVRIAAGSTEAVKPGDHSNHLAVIGMNSMDSWKLARSTMAGCRSYLLACAAQHTNWTGRTAYARGGA